MHSGHRPESSNIEAVAAVAPDLYDGTLRLLELRLEQVRLSALRRLALARRRLSCLLFGHERWTSIVGDWSCMRCHKVERPGGLGFSPHVRDRAVLYAHPACRERGPDDESSILM